MKYILTILTIATLFSCSKEGVGGSSLISGKVEKRILTRNGDVVETIPAADKSVFIIYGSESYYNDDVKTDLSGYFEFPFLEKGDYELFAYSDCIDCSTGKNTKNQTVSLSRGENTEVTLTVDKVVDYDDGNSVLSGVLMEQEYVGSFPVNAPFVSQENEVYITYGNDDVYFDRMDTGFDGKFEFHDLIQGTYTIYAYSKCGTCVNVDDTVSYQVEITSNNSLIEGDTLTIEMR